MGYFRKEKRAVIEKEVFPDLVVYLYQAFMLHSVYVCNIHNSGDPK
jgi:hypothetical protein